jgi:hypothetical protein
MPPVSHGNTLLNGPERLLNDTNGVNSFGAAYAIWDLHFMPLGIDRHIGRMLAMELEHCPKIDGVRISPLITSKGKSPTEALASAPAVPMGRSSSTYSMCTPKIFSIMKVFDNAFRQIVCRDAYMLISGSAEFANETIEDWSAAHRQHGLWAIFRKRH